MTSLHLLPLLQNDSSNVIHPRNPQVPCCLVCAHCDFILLFSSVLQRSFVKLKDVILRSRSAPFYFAFALSSHYPAASKRMMVVMILHPPLPPLSSSPSPSPPLFSCCYDLISSPGMILYTKSYIFLWSYSWPWTDYLAFLDLFCFIDDIRRKLG